MNIKKTVKKMTAVLTGATMLGATVMGAMAMDLGDYPSPLIENGAWNGKVVVGAVAAAEDIAGAAALAAGLQTYSKVPVSVGGGVITVEGGETFEKDMNTAFELGKLDYRKLEGFKDGEFRIGTDTYKYRDYLEVAGNNLSVVTSVANTDEDYGAEPYLNVLHEEAIKYYVDFRGSTLNNTDLGTRTATFELLGKQIEITDIGTTSVTIEASNEYFMEEGDSVTIDGREVILQRVGAQTVLVSVDGEVKTVGATDDVIFTDGALDFIVRMDNLPFYIEGASDNAASLTLGEEALQDTVSAGDPATLFGQVDDRSEATWVWHLEFDGDDKLSQIGVKSNHVREDVEVTRARDRPAIAVGETIELPNNYAAIEFVGLSEVNHYGLTMDLIRDIDFLNEDDDSVEGFAIEFNIEGGDYFEFSDVADTMSTVYAVYSNNSNDGWEYWYFEGSDEMKVATAGANLQLVLDNDAITIVPASTGVGVGAVTFGGMTPFDNIVVAYTAEGTNQTALTNGTSIATKVYFGTDDGEAAAADLNIGGTLGTAEYDILTTYGVAVDNPYDQFRSTSGTFTMMFPQNAQEAVVVASGPGTRTTATEGGAYQVVPIPPADVGVLDSEVMNMIGTIPMLVVGGPNANTVAANLLDVQQFSDEIAELFEPNKAMIKLFEDQNAILVAGYEGKDTRAASLALADFEANKDKFAGNKEVEVIVSGTSVSAINAPN